LKKSIVFLKYALKMDLVKGEWFDLYPPGPSRRSLVDSGSGSTGVMTSLPLRYGS